MSPLEGVTPQCTVTGSIDGDRSPGVQSPEIEAATGCPVTGNKAATGCPVTGSIGRRAFGNVQGQHVDSHRWNVKS